MLNKCQSCASSNISQFLGSEDTKAIAFYCNDCYLVQIKKTNKMNKVTLDDSEIPQREIVLRSKFVDEIVDHLNLNEDSFILELVNSKSVFRQFFKDKKIDCVTAKSIDDSNSEPFGIEQAWSFISESHPISKGRKPDLIIANNIMSHSHDINEVLEAMMLILKDGGSLIVDDVYISSIFELDNHADILNKSDFWLSTHSLGKACERHGLKIVDAHIIDKTDEDDMAKMRWTIQHDNMFSVSPNVIAILGNEVEQGYIDVNKYLEMSS